MARKTEFAEKPFESIFFKQSDQSLYRWQSDKKKLEEMIQLLVAKKESEKKTHKEKKVNQLTTQGNPKKVNSEEDMDKSIQMKYVDNCELKEFLSFFFSLLFSMLF